MYRILFFGTSDFAVPSLEALVLTSPFARGTERVSDPRFDVVGVVTQPDRPVGRHAKITPSPIKKSALARGITEIHQPEKLKEETFVTWIKEVGSTCDAFVVASYGKILPTWLLELPKKGCINVHGSLLPRWRGASPIQAAIAAGDTMSGITIMLMDADLDHGPILAQAKEPISDSDTGGSLHDRLALLGANLLPNILADYLAGEISPTEQDHSIATTCRTLTRDDGKIDPTTETADTLEKRIRAYNPWPGTWMDFNGQRLKILAATLSPSDKTKKPGERFITHKKPLIACAKGTTLELARVQPEGKKPMTGEELLRGKHDWINGNL